MIFNPWPQKPRRQAVPADEFRWLPTLLYVVAHVVFLLFMFGVCLYALPVLFTAAGGY